MAESEISMSGGSASAEAGPHINETVLRSEIAFWQEMIGSVSSDLPVEAVERMQHALALAERKLSHFYGAHAGAIRQNVYQLDQARRIIHD
jgi:hypothetical protein